MSGWQKQLTDFLESLLQSQKDVVALLERKRELFQKNDPAAIGEMAQEEQAAADRLKQCLAEREKLLQYASAEGLPAQTIESLARAIVPYTNEVFFELLASVQRQTQLLRQHNITNWVLTQRGMLHSSQMLEIIATRGRLQSTYNRQRQRNIGPTGGSLVDCKG